MHRLAGPARPLQGLAGGLEASLQQPHACLSDRVVSGLPAPREIPLRLAPAVLGGLTAAAVVASASGAGRGPRRTRRSRAPAAAKSGRRRSSSGAEPQPSPAPSASDRRLKAVEAALEAALARAAEAEAKAQGLVQDVVNANAAKQRVIEAHRGLDAGGVSQAIRASEQRIQELEDQIIKLSAKLGGSGKIMSEDPFVDTAVEARLTQRVAEAEARAREAEKRAKEAEAREAKAREEMETDKLLAIERARKAAAAKADAERRARKRRAEEDRAAWEREEQAARELANLSAAGAMVMEGLESKERLRQQAQKRAGIGLEEEEQQEEEEEEEAKELEEEKEEKEKAPEEEEKKEAAKPEVAAPEKAAPELEERRETAEAAKPVAASVEEADLEPETGRETPEAGPEPEERHMSAEEEQQRAELEELKKSIKAKKEQLKVLGLTPKEVNKSKEVVAMVELKRAMPEEAPEAAAADGGGVTEAPEEAALELSPEEEEERDDLQSSLELLQGSLMDKAGLTAEEVEQDADVQELRKALEQFGVDTASLDRVAKWDMPQKFRTKKQSLKDWYHRKYMRRTGRLGTHWFNKLSGKSFKLKQKLKKQFIQAKIKAERRKRRDAKDREPVDVSGEKELQDEQQA